MRQEIIRTSLLRRVRRRSNLLLVALVGGLFSLFREIADKPGFPAFEILFPFLLLFAHLALSPIPWQWTGDDEPKAGFGRGFLQALGFNAAWVSLCLMGLHVFAPSHPRMPPPPGLEGRGRPPLRPRPISPGLGLGLANVGFAIAFGWVFAEKEASEAKTAAMADLLRASRSRALQNQLKPHVLYNALNSLSELVHEDPLAAEEVIARLADLYRMLTIHGEAERVPLAQERRLVEAYLAMEQMRLGERLRILWDWPSTVDEVALPPLFLQPLVENAIKHGISPCAEGGDLFVRGGLEGRVLSLRVENTGHLLEFPWEAGVGLRNLEARLALWTEAEGSFRLERCGERTVALLRWRLP